MMEVFLIYDLRFTMVRMVVSYILRTQISAGGIRVHLSLVPHPQTSEVCAEGRAVR